jgi:hypothetical protein
LRHARGLSYLDSYSEHDGIKISPWALAPSPDRSIVRRLKEHDKHLDVVWSLRRQRWVVTVRNLRRHEKREIVMVVQNDDRSYRPLDERVIVNIKLADAFRYDDIHHFKKIMDEGERAVDKRMAKELTDAFRDRNEDLYRAYFGYKSVPVGLDLSRPFAVKELGR